MAFYLTKYITKGAELEIHCALSVALQKQFTRNRSNERICGCYYTIL